MPLRSRRPRRGGALLLALVMAVGVAAMVAAVLQLSALYARKQERFEADTRAFYLAESGLAESYLALTSGGSGRIASQDAPARSGDGLLWVDVSEVEGNRARLECTALSGKGRAKVAITVARSERSLGVFSAGAIDVPAGAMVDGFDSRLGSYASQLEIDPAWIDATEPLGKYLAKGHPTEVGATYLCECDSWHMFLASDGKRVSLHDLGPEFEPDSPSFQGPHAKETGILATNGGVALATGSAVWGDVLAGPSALVVAAAGSSISGVSMARPAALVLNDVVPPGLPMQAPIVHSSGVPLALPAGQYGIETLEVQAGAEVEIAGPSLIELGGLRVHPDGQLTINNALGRVDLYVANALELLPGSRLSVSNQDPTQLTLRIIGDVPDVRLASESSFVGVLYGPQAGVWIEAPFQVFGSVSAGELHLAPGARLHFDAAIEGAEDALALPKLIAWEFVDLPTELKLNSAASMALQQLDLSSLPSASAAAESLSWTIDATYTVGGQSFHFVGPLQDFDVTNAKNVSFSLEPPSSATAVAWTLALTYQPSPGPWVDYQGPVSGFGVTSWKQVKSMVLTPPAALADAGFTIVTKKQ